MSEKIIFSEKYTKTEAILKKDSLPILRNINDGFECIGGRLLEAGKVVWNKKEVEYIDMRVFIEERN